jgi:hypothetical protein
MAATSRRWAHSLKTGEPYTTEYRCRRKDGEWRWMLGRALPFRNKQTNAIERWFGSCTDVHEAVESRFSARRMVSGLLGHSQLPADTLQAPTATFRHHPCSGYLILC